MKSDDMRMTVGKRMMELAGGLLPLAFKPKEKRGGIFKEVLYEYSISKLADTEENKVVVESLPFLFSRLRPQFKSEEEKNAFYDNYAFLILEEYGFLTGENLVWMISKTEEQGEFPCIANGHFKTRQEMSSEDATLWLFKQYEKELAKESREDSKDKKQKKKKASAFEFKMKW